MAKYFEMRVFWPLVLFLIGVICADLKGVSGNAGSVKNFSVEDFEASLKHIIVPAASYRLNLTVKPLHYNLRMRPVLDAGFANLPQFSVPSSVNITVTSITNGSCNHITLHQRNLTIDLNNVRVRNLQTGQGLAVDTQTFEEARDLYTIQLKDSFNFGDNLEIYVPFTVELSQTENVGVYLGHYVNPDTNQTHYLSTTKLEPYHARKVFPLFDEPSFKARFSISVGRLEGKYHSLSNMEIVETEKDPQVDGWVWDHYQESVLMSPYLVCVIVSDFANDTVQIPELNRTVSTWAPKHDIQAQGGSFGSSTGAKLVDFYEQRFKMDYVLRKLDAVALPQFASGAMENFGLVTYRYEYLVWIPGENTEAERRKVTQVLAHEIVHQWYGNIVTCGWWSEIWLNEGFARYFQFWGMNATIPEFLVEEAFVNDATQLAMVFDQGPSTHPVRNSAESTTESAAVFDRISYEKAASLLRMMEGFLGRSVLETGIVDVYLRNRQWDVAYQEDLFYAIQEAVVSLNVTHRLPGAGVTVEDVMTEWTLTSGYPLLRVDVLNSNAVIVSQERFAENGKIAAPKREDGHWWIPVKIVNSPTSSPSTDHFPDLWIPNNVSAMTYSSDELDTGKLLMVNPDATGYYRVLYDAKLTSLIKAQLEGDHKRITSISRSQFLDDYFNLALAGRYIQVESALELTRYLGKEAASNVWTAVLVHLKPILAKVTEDAEALKAFQSYFLPRLEGALEIIGTRQAPEERGINVTLRVQLLNMACELGSLSCGKYAVELIEEWMQSPEASPFPVDLRPALYCTAVAESNATVWNFFLSQFSRIRKDALKMVVLNALACSKDTIILTHLLELSVNTTSTLTQHTDHILGRVAVNPVGRALVYEFAKSNLLSSKITANTFAATVSALSSYWGKTEDVQALRTFVESNGDALQSVQASLEASLRNIVSNVDWWSTFGRRIMTWLKNSSRY